MWPFDRGRSSTSPVGDRVEPPPEERWNSLEPIELALARPPTTADVDEFIASLATRRPPALSIAPLEHDVAIAAPPGLVSLRPPVEGAPRRRLIERIAGVRRATPPSFALGPSTPDARAASSEYEPGLAPVELEHVGAEQQGGPPTLRGPWELPQPARAFAPAVRSTPSPPQRVGRTSATGPSQSRAVASPPGEASPQDAGPQPAVQIEAVRPITGRSSLTPRPSPIPARTPTPSRGEAAPPGPGGIPVQRSDGPPPAPPPAVYESTAPERRLPPTERLVVRADLSPQAAARELRPPSGAGIGRAIRTFPPAPSIEAIAGAALPPPTPPVPRTAPVSAFEADVLEPEPTGPSPIGPRAAHRAATAPEPRVAAVAPREPASAQPPPASLEPRSPPPMTGAIPRAPAPPPAPAAVAPPMPAALASGTDLESLADDLYEHVRARLTTELLLDRERASVPIDLS